MKSQALHTHSNLANEQGWDIRFLDVSSLIVKVTKRCNLNCDYCYENIVSQGDMSIETFKDLAHRAFTNSRREHLDFVFHGGEPTLLPDSFFAEAFETCQTLAKQTGKSLGLSIQSNLYNLTPSKVKLFQDYDVSVGVSLDGPSDLMDAMRPGSRRVSDNFLRLRDQGLRLGVLMTINQSNFDKFDNILNWLHSEMSVSNFKANVVYAVGSGQLLEDMKPEQIFLAQKTILDYMLTHQLDGVLEHNLVWKMNWFLQENSHETNSLCHAQHCGAGSKVLGITPEGKILPCGRFQWNDAEYYLGDLSSEVPLESEFSEKVNEFHAHNPENWFNCGECDAKKICNFGCQAFISRSRSRANVECLPTKMLYAYFQDQKAAIQELWQSLRDNQNFLVDGYSDEKYGDGVKTPYVDKYADKYSDN